MLFNPPTDIYETPDGLVLYADEGHGIKQLPHREDVLRRVLEWFDRHDPGPAGK